MNIILLCIIIILFFSFLIFLQVMTRRAIIKKAINKFIKPELEEKGLSLIDYKWAGFLSTGYFPNDFGFTIMNKNGSASNSFYTDISYQNRGEIKRVTARIDTFMFKINKITYSSEL